LPRVRAIRRRWWIARSICSTSAAPPLRHSIGGIDQHIFEMLPFGVRERIVRTLVGS
jgi:hypothetical protein